MTDKEVYFHLIPEALKHIVTDNHLLALGMSFSDLRSEVFALMVEQGAIEKFKGDNQTAKKKYVFQCARRIVAGLFKKTKWGREKEHQRDKERYKNPERKAYLAEYEKTRPKRERRAYMRLYMQWYRKQKKKK